MRAAEQTSTLIVALEARPTDWLTVLGGVLLCRHRSQSRSVLSTGCLACYILVKLYTIDEALKEIRH